jgi:cytochrome c oxidase subunit 2
MVVAGVIATAILIPVALVIPWFPTNASKQAGNVRTLYDVLLIATVPIFVLVETVVLFSVWKFRMKPGEEEKDGPPIHGNTRLEVVWTVLPACLILGLCAYAYTVLHSNEKSEAGEMTVNVTTRQFAFEFSYPGLDGKTVVSPVLYLPKGKPIVFKLRSLDVIHSFFVPEFSEKIDAVPGITTTLRVTPTRLGTYPAECTELCGPGHSLMRATVHVVTPVAFQTWASAQPANIAPPLGTPPPNAAEQGEPGAPPSSPSSSSGNATTGPSSRSSTAPPASSSTTPPAASATSAAAGKTVFTQTASPTCSTCHTLAAASATGTVGPDLDTRLRSDCATPASKRVRGETLQKCIYIAITSPYKYIPSGYQPGIMPSTFAKTLTGPQIGALVRFLSTAAK